MAEGEGEGDWTHTHEAKMRQSKFLLCSHFVLENPLLPDMVGRIRDRFLLANSKNSRLLV